MRFVLFSDLHAHAFPEFGAGERLQDCLSVLTDIRAYCIEKKIKDVFFGGDLFHKRGVLWTLPYVCVAHELLAYKKAGIRFRAVDGNHDHEDKEGKTHALQPLMAGGLIKGIGDHGWRNILIGGVCVTMFAFCEVPNVLRGRIAESQRDSKGAAIRIALFHHGFKGARVGSTLEYEVKEPIDARELELDESYDLVFSGHYHSHQSIVGVESGWYIGSPLEHTRSDRSPERKGFLVVNTKDLSFRRVPLRRPRFIQRMVGDSLKTVNGNFVDVIYETVDGLDTYLDALRKHGARAVNPIPLPSAKQVAEVRLDVSPALSPAKVLRRYVKHKRKEIQECELDRAALISLGLELLSE
jgi:DNA repair exonuclease SbcCD nuclease subunit